MSTEPVIPAASEVYATLLRLEVWHDDQGQLKMNAAVETLRIIGHQRNKHGCYVPVAQDGENPWESNHCIIWSPSKGTELEAVRWVLRDFVDSGPATYTTGYAPNEEQKKFDDLRNELRTQAELALSFFPDSFEHS